MSNIEFCPNCGIRTSLSIPFCTNCGARLRPSENDQILLSTSQDSKQGAHLRNGAHRLIQEPTPRSKAINILLIALVSVAVLCGLGWGSYSVASEHQMQQTEACNSATERLRKANKDLDAAASRAEQLDAERGSSYMDSTDFVTWKDIRDSAPQQAALPDCDAVTSSANSGSEISSIRNDAISVESYAKKLNSATQRAESQFAPQVEASRLQ